MGVQSGTIEQLARDTARIADPEVALRALTALRQQLDATEPELVQRALEAGASWSRIARALGITKQAAHRKYRYVFDHAFGASAGGPRVVVTNEARQVMQFAREEAKRLGQPRGRHRARAPRNPPLPAEPRRQGPECTGRHPRVGPAQPSDHAARLPSNPSEGAPADGVTPPGPPHPRRIAARDPQAGRGPHRRRASAAGAAVRLTQRRGSDARGSADDPRRHPSSPRPRAPRRHSGHDLACDRRRRTGAPPRTARRLARPPRTTPAAGVRSTSRSRPVSTS